MANTPNRRRRRISVDGVSHTPFRVVTPNPGKEPCSAAPPNRRSDTEREDAPHVRAQRAMTCAATEDGDEERAATTDATPSRSSRTAALIHSPPEHTGMRRSESETSAARYTPRTRREAAKTKDPNAHTVRANAARVRVWADEAARSAAEDNHLRYKN